MTGRLMKRGSAIRSLFRPGRLGPGLITGAADDDPSGIATYSQAGAQFGFGLLWTLLLTYPLMTAVQLVSAHIGRVTGRGLAANMTAVLWRPVVIALAGLLFVANTINIGADLAAMGDAAELVVGGGAHAFTIAFALTSFVLQLFMPYRRYASLLKTLTLALFAYAAVLFLVKIDWQAVALDMIVPRIDGKAAAISVVAIFGTTISPYLFFWQSAQEAEEIKQTTSARPLITAPEQARRAFDRMRIDTLLGMAVSNMAALAIMIGTAATLGNKGSVTIGSAADAAQALEPVAGRFAFLLFSAGIIGTGLLAVPVLAGSAAYAVGELFEWEAGLDRQPQEARGFYAVIGLATILGIGIDWSAINPIRALFWSAVLNGVVAVPIMAAMMTVASRRDAMGRFTVSGPLLLFGWLATAVMAVAALTLVIL